MFQMAAQAENLPTWDPENDRHFIGLISKHPSIWDGAKTMEQGGELAWTKIREDEIVGKFSIDVLKERWQMLYTNHRHGFKNLGMCPNADCFKFLLAEAAQSSESISTDAPERVSSSSPLPTPEEAASARATAALVSAKIIKIMENHHSFGLDLVGGIIEILDKAQIEVEKYRRRISESKRAEMDVFLRTVRRRVDIRVRSQQRENEMKYLIYCFFFGTWQTFGTHRNPGQAATNIYRSPNPGFSGHQVPGSSGQPQI